MDGTGDQIDDQENENGTEPPGSIHVKKVKKVQYIIEINSVSLNIFRTWCILRDNGPDDRENGEQDEQSDGEFEGTEKIEKDFKKSFFFFADLYFRFIHGIRTLKEKIYSIYPFPFCYSERKSFLRMQGSN
jgi:hypothetical protein